MWYEKEGNGGGGRRTMAFAILRCGVQIFPYLGQPGLAGLD